MKKIVLIAAAIWFLLSACEKQEPLVYSVNKSAELLQYESELAAEQAFQESLTQESIAESLRVEEEKAALEALIWKKKDVRHERTKVKGIYLTDVTAGGKRMDEIISYIDQTELNAVVIDIKNDRGRIAYQMDSPLVSETGSQSRNIEDLPGLMKKLKEHGIYTIARIVSFRDPFMADVRPEWMNRKSDGSVFYDNSKMAWANPYKREYWEYLAEVGSQCAAAGFDEVQFDYVRFCTERGMNDVVYDEADTEGLSKTQIITEFVKFISDRMAEQDIFCSVDVFGTIIDSYIDSTAVGQDYAEMAACVDYMCPMIYPSHYGNGNFGIEYPDMDPYGTISGALASSQRALFKEDESYQAIVRPWLQAFTATWLSNHAEYGPKELRAQIQAVYDSGYDEWIFWNASNIYDWSAFQSS